MLDKEVRIQHLRISKGSKDFVDFLSSVQKLMPDSSINGSGLGIRNNIYHE